MGNAQTVTVAGRVLEVKQQIGEGAWLCVDFMNHGAAISFLGNAAGLARGVTAESEQVRLASGVSIRVLVRCGPQAHTRWYTAS